MPGPIGHISCPSHFRVVCGNLVSESFPGRPARARGARSRRSHLSRRSRRPRSPSLGGRIRGKVRDAIRVEVRVGPAPPLARAVAPKPASCGGCPRSRRLVPKRRVRAMGPPAHTSSVHGGGASPSCRIPRPRCWWAPQQGKVVGVAGSRHCRWGSPQDRQGRSAEGQTGIARSPTPTELVAFELVAFA